MGFVFGERLGEKVCYISDISRMPPESLALLKAQGPLALLVVDALLLQNPHPTHYSVQQAVQLCRELRPRRALLVGMGPQVEHFAVNEQLRELLHEEGLDVQLAHDGLAVEVTL